ncbi:MAG TPA: VIT1/CCC1 family protein [Candidatus Bathyarchaeia archaeon]|nr:VIT1/CCC1 family protein [Candidatus Bathyarchaeia archaeon]
MSTAGISQELVEVAYMSAKDELNEYAIYKKYSELRTTQKSEFKNTLVRLAGMEYKHYQFWKKFCPDHDVTVNRLKLTLMVFVRIFLGVTFAFKLLERTETEVIKQYKEIAHLVPSEDQQMLHEIIGDEEEHEKEFADQFNEPHIKYISFIVLGLADALVEIAGIHAGSLGIYVSTELAGLAGIIAGAAASMAMASAAYAQAKTGFKGSAGLSAIYTGVSYFLTAIILATPYFLTKIMLNALLVSLAAGIILIAFTSFYGSIIAGSSFRKDFVEVTSIMLGATVALYLLGTVLRYLTGMTI